MELPAWLLRVAEPWASAYSDSTALRIAVLFTHLGALLLGGGIAVAADRGTLRAARHPAARSVHLAELATVHGWVVGALALSLASGVLLTLSDLETYASAPLYWSKLGLVALLLANGALLRHTGTTLTRPPDAGKAGDAGWRRLVRHARLSLALWLATTLVGVALTEAG